MAASRKKKGNGDKNGFYLALFVVFLFLAGAGAGHKFILQLYLSSVPVNSVILLCSAGSVALVLRYILSVSKEVDSLRQFKCWSEEPGDEARIWNHADLFLLGPVLGPLNKTMAENGSLALESTSDLRSIVSGIEQNIDQRKSLVSFLAGFLVMLGLFGTFLGLTITLQSMGHILDTLATGLDSSSQTSILKVMVQLIVELKRPMAGMGTAFSTSLFGLIGSSLVGLLSLLLNRSHEQLKRRVELWLSTTITNEGSTPLMGGGGGIPESVGEQLLVLSRQIEQNNDLLTESLEKSNKFLLEMTILQQRSSEVQQVIQEQAIETTGGVKLGNDLSGRLIRECKEIAELQSSISGSLSRMIDRNKGNGKS